MKLLRMTASFGRLNNETIAFTEGLNLVTLPNEGGKSTWCAFLRAMFYGIPTAQRDKIGFLAEKNRYQPWSGAPLEGTLDLVWKGREITLRRGSKGNAPFGLFAAVYTGTEEAVPGITGENCGETILGVGREVFERTAFVGQAGVTIGSAPELETRIASLASAGEEDVSFSETQRRLRDWKNTRMANKAVGAIPRLEEKLDKVGQTLAELRQAENTAARAGQELDDLALRHQRLEGEKAYHMAQQTKERRARYETLEFALKTAQTEEKSLKAELARFGDLPTMEALRDAQMELTYLNTLEVNIKQTSNDGKAAETAAREARIAATDPLFPNMVPEEARAKVGSDSARILRVSRKPTGLWVLSAVLLLLSMIPIFFSVNQAVELGPRLNLAALIAGGALVALAVGFAIAAVVVKRGRSAQKKGLLALYGASNVGELDARCAQFEAAWRLALEAERGAEVFSLQVAQISRQKEELLQKLREFAKPFAPDATDSVSLAVAFSRGLMLRDKLEKAAAHTEEARKVWQAVSAEGIPTGLVAVDIIRTDATPQETAAALAATEAEQTRLQDALSRAKGEMGLLGDSTALQAQEGLLREEIGALRREYDALSMALEGLEAANASLQTRFSPEVNRRAGEIFARLTGGKYSAVAITRDFEALATEAGGLLPRRALALSEGAENQLYLAVRLAVCDLVLPQEEPDFLVLDDALVTFDDCRLKLALAYLKERGSGQQILLFSCQDREKRILALS